MQLKLNTMKNTLTILSIFLFLLSCKAQQPIIPLYNGSDYLDTNNAYYKDTQGDLSKLVGTWEFSDGNEVFKIILSKKLNHFVDITYRNISYYKDVLYGEYRYVDINGNEMVNTLPDINNFSNDIYQHLINGNFIRSAARYIPCNSCDPNKRIVEVFIEDPQRDYFKYSMQIMHIPADTFNPEKIKIFIYNNIMAIIPTGQPNDNRLPYREEYTLIKQ